MFDLCTRLHVDDERAYSYRYCSDIFRCVFSFLGALGSMERGIERLQLVDLLVLFLLGLVMAERCFILR